MHIFRLLRRQRSDTDVALEMDENLARGMNEEEAHHQAYLKFGSPRRIREEIWQRNTVAVLDNLRRDLTYAVRTLRRDTGFTVIAILIMALGIGSVTAMFTVIRSVLLKPLPFHDPDRLVVLYQHDPHAADPDNYVAIGNFFDWQKNATGFSEMAAVTPWASYKVSDADGSTPETIAAAWCSWNLFSILDVQPAYGRTFTAQDDSAGANATVLLSWGFWKRRFGGDPKIVGHNIFLNQKSYTVIGVMPRWFTYPLARVEVWTPLHHEGSVRLLASRDDHEFKVLARLKPGVAMAQAVSALSLVQKHIRDANPVLPIEPEVSGHLLLDDIATGYKTPLYVLLAATECLLLIACLNVANLLVARAAARRKDAAIRAALGGSRWRLIREQLTESLMLATAGGGLGIFIAYAAVAWLTHMRQNFPRVDAIHPDGIVFLFVTAITLASGTLAGLIPALSNNHSLEALQESSRSYSSGPTRTRTRKFLLAAEVCLTVILLLAAGLLLKSYVRLRSTNMGCATRNVLTMQWSLNGPPEKRAAFFTSLLERVRALPGVSAAGLVTTAPGTGWWQDSPIEIIGHALPPKGTSLDPIWRSADPGYFVAMQIPLLRGRVFTENDGLNSHAVVLSESAARQFFQGQDPIGQHIRILGHPENPALEVVGIVGDTRFHVTEPFWPTMYQPILSGQFGQATLVVCSNQDVDPLVHPIQSIFAQMDSTLALSSVLTMQQILGHSTVDANFNATLVLAFAGIALLLASVGLYGVLSYLVTQRINEIGIRIALGAQRSDVMQLMLLDGLKPVWIGLALGLIGGGFAVQLIRSMLYGASPLDGSIFTEVALLLMFVAIVACIVPAWRGARLDPAQALRAE